jgi:ribonuclease E
MPDPLDNNDDWAELARELERDKPPAPPADMVERRVIEEEAVEPHHGTDPRLEEEVVAEGEPEAAADEEFEGEEGAPAEAAEGAAEGQPGTGRKRRRRRRRRRTGAPSPAGDAPPEAAEAEEGEAEPVAAEEEVAEAEEFGAEDAEAELVPFGAEEDTASEVLRDLIANWNVPSWDEIVGGLYRPGQ